MTPVSRLAERPWCQCRLPWPKGRAGTVGVGRRSGRRSVLPSLHSLSRLPPILEDNNYFVMCNIVGDE
eukprot:scaffold4111_cov132-Isochrysis_galbana.AAC.1